MAQSESDAPNYAAIRDTTESVWVAIVLAFVLRAFVVEAFVIPTGSMAPRLMGEHFDLVCPQCGYSYAFGWNDKEPLQRGKPYKPDGARCPNCGAPYCPEDGSTCNAYVNGGDRVLVLKYLYAFKPPQPWDVVVFRNPNNNRQNFIKRLIGLPGETIEVIHGDVFYKPQGESDFRIRRKPAAAQDELWQVVYDNDYRPDEQWIRKGHDEGRTPVWQPVNNEQAWTIASTGLASAVTHSGRVFHFHGSDNWAELELAAGANVFLPRYGYNSWAQPPDRSDICTDLKLSTVFVPREQPAAVKLTLSSFDRTFEAVLSSAGTATLTYTGNDGEPVTISTAVPPLRMGKGYQVALAHADLQASLWLEDKCLLVTDDEHYLVSYEQLKGMSARGKVPLPRVKLSALGGRSEMWHVTLMRDVYYTAMGVSSPEESPLGDYARRPDYMPTKIAAGQLTAPLSQLPPTSRNEPPGWGVRDNPIKLAQHQDAPDMDEFYVLGDNSPVSHDSRAWTSAAPALHLLNAQGQPVYTLGTVPRYTLIGRAMFVYWPAPYRLPGKALPGLPLVPNVGEMRFIR
jgi:signal peptidase I